MQFTDVASWLWAGITGGGVFVLAVAYAVLLLQRRRERGRVALSGEALAPAPDARASGRALHVFDIINLLIGIWIAISVWVFGGNYHGYGSALAASNVVFGIAIAMFSLAAAYRLHALEELANALLAVWVGISPWVIGTATIRPALEWSNAASATAVIVLSLLGLFRVLRPSAHLVGHRHGQPSHHSR
jgi:hypothetical protein